MRDHSEESFSDGTPFPPEEPPPGKGKGPSQAQQLMAMAEDTYRLIRSTDGRDRALVIHLPAGQARCDLHWMDITAGWDAAQLAAAARAWRSRRDLTQPYDPGTPVPQHAHGAAA